jgi:hypothetical protein
VFEVRTPIPVIKVQFGVGECVTDFFELQKSLVYTTLSIPLSSLKSPPGLPTPCPPNLNDVHIVFTVVTNSSNAPDGGTILFDNIRFEPVPASQQSARSFPLSTQTFVVVPLPFPSSGRVPFPPIRSSGISLPPTNRRSPYWRWSHEARLETLARPV